MKHLTTGLLLGAAAAGIAWACGASPWWAVLLGAGFGAVVWAAADALDRP